MRNIFSTKITLLLLALNGCTLCMQRTTTVIPTLTKNSRSAIKHSTHFYTTQPNRFHEDRMAFYKQFSKEVISKNDNFTHQQAQPQLHNIDEKMDNHKEDRMAFYKQFSEPKK